MAHLVRYRTRAGEIRHEEVRDLDAAIALVERLRNDGEGEDVRVFDEVALQFQTYVKVSVAAGDVAPAPSPAPASAPKAESAAPPPPAASTEPPPGAMPLTPVTVPAAPADVVDVADGEKRSLFHRG